MRGDDCRWVHSHLLQGGRRRLLLGATLAVGLVLAMSSSASAMTIGLNWNGVETASEALERVEYSGATVYHRPLEYNGPGGNWSGNDQLVEEAWKRGVTILPTLSRGSGSGETRFLRSSDPAWGPWGTWVREAVERYGVNGSFWTGKSNPTPITAWEVWNEPNRIEENPKINETECAAEGMTYLPWAGTCYQPKAYGLFLKYTGEAIQAGSYTKTAHGTEVLFGGLYTPGGYEFMRYVELAASVPGVAGGFTGIAIHPYSLISGSSEFESTVRKARNWSNEIGLNGKSIWITEMGWPVGGSENFPTGGKPVSEAEQSSLLTASFNWLKSVSGTYNIPFAAWFNVRDYNTGNKWPGYCGLLTSSGAPRSAWYAFQAETGVEGTGTQYTAFQANTHALWFYLSTTSYGYNTGAGMEPESSPSATPAPRVGDEIAFQDWHHELWIYSTATGVAESTGMGMQPGTSPSIAYRPGAGYLIAFQDWHHELWTYSTGTRTGFDTTLGMEEHSSPSLAVKADGSYAIAFQANNHELWYYPSSTGLGVPTSLGMQPGTSPSTASVPAGGYRIAFQDWHHELWTYPTATGLAFDTTLGMEEHSSPSLAVKADGSYAIAFQANNHELWYYPSSTGLGVPTSLGMQPGTSPSIGVIPSASYQIAFQDWHHELWIYSAATGTYGTTTLGMYEYSSPSLAIRN